jgi:hypothetical protein
MGARLEIPPYIPETRWLVPYQCWGVSATSNTATAGRVWLLEFEVASPVSVDTIVIRNEGTVAGNVIVGIYGPVVTPDTCAGSPLVVESASSALSGSSTTQSISIAQTQLSPGLYYVAVQYSDATHTYGRVTGSIVALGWTQFYDRGGGYGALTNPCPAITNSASSVPNARVRGVV